MNLWLTFQQINIDFGALTRNKNCTSTVDGRHLLREAVCSIITFVVSTFDTVFDEINLNGGGILAQRANINNIQIEKLD